MIKRKLFIFLLIFTTTAFLLLLFLAQDILTSESVTKIGKTNKSCNLYKAYCLSTFGPKKQLSFSISPNKIKVLTPLTLNVNFTGIEAKTVSIEIEGLNMDMGFNQTTLSKYTKNHFQGKITLPSCMEKRMRWEVRILTKTAKDTLQSHFYFKTDKA